MLITDRGSDMQNRTSVRMTGKVKATLPDRGFFWITGDDGVKYFAHQTKVKYGFPIYDMWEGQPCSFEPKVGDSRGPSAEAIEMGNAQT